MNNQFSQASTSKKRLIIIAITLAIILFATTAFALRTVSNSKQSDESKTVTSQSATTDSKTSSPEVIGTKEERDEEREMDLSMIEVSLEIYKKDKGFYPSLTLVNTPAWREENLPFLKDHALLDPSNPTVSPELTEKLTPGRYSYMPTTSDGQPCSADPSSCLAATLLANRETELFGRIIDDRFLD